MVSAYILVKLLPYADGIKTKRKLCKLDKILSVHRTYGLYDMIILVHSEGIADLKETMLNTIRLIDDIDTTITMIAMDEYTRE